MLFPTLLGFYLATTGTFRNLRRWMIRAMDLAEVQDIFRYNSKPRLGHEKKAARSVRSRSARAEMGKGKGRGTRRRHGRPMVGDWKMFQCYIGFWL